MPLLRLPTWRGWHLIVYFLAWLPMVSFVTVGAHLAFFEGCGNHSGPGALGLALRNGGGNGKGPIMRRYDIEIEANICPRLEIKALPAKKGAASRRTPKRCRFPRECAAGQEIQLLWSG